MIRADRDVLDLRAIARLHGLPWDTARRRRPWARPDHPRPVNRPARGVPALYDAEQVAAAAAAKPVPPLPTAEQPGDLLDAHEVTEALNLRPATWRAYLHEGYAPPADAEPYGVPHWSRATVHAWREQRPGRGWWGPREATGSPGERARAVLAHAEAGGERGLTITELARRARVSRSTLRAARRSTDGPQ